MTDEERAREISEDFSRSPIYQKRLQEQIERAFAAIRADEREKCADLIEPKRSYSLWTFGDKVAHECAAAIRGMGDKG